MVLAVCLDAVDDDLAELADGAWLVGGTVGDAQATADVELADRLVAFGADEVHEVNDDLDGLLVAVQGEYLRPDVHVQAGKLDARQLKRT